MHSRQSNADRMTPMHNVARSCVAACAVIATTEDVFADSIRYVDRNGHSHDVVVRREQTPPTPAAEPVPSTKDVAPVVAVAIPYIDHVREAATLYSLPIELIAAVMKIESGGDPKAVSIAGAMGLMQLMPGTAEDMQVLDAFHPRQNILGGARYLRILINTYDGSLALALAAYNAGTATVEKYGGIPPYPDTHKYVVQVIDLYHRYKETNAQASEKVKPTPARTRK